MSVHDFAARRDGRCRDCGRLPRDCDGTDADEATDRAVALADLGADPDWRERALDVLEACALTMATFTTDALWARLDGDGPTTRDRRALGPVIREAVDRGWITATGSYERTERTVAHRNPKRVWRSRLYAGR